MLLSICVLSIVCILDIMLCVAIWISGLRDPFLLFVAIVAGHILICAGMVRALMFLRPIKEGTFDLKSPEASRWMAQAVVALISAIYFDPFVPFMLRPAWCRLFGAKIGRGVNIAGRVIDFSLITLHDGAQIGGDAMILGHYITRDRIRIGRVTLHKNALAGARSLLFPGVTIKDGGVAGAMSLVPAGRTIGAGESWAGNPATRLSATHAAPENVLNEVTELAEHDDAISKLLSKVMAPQVASLGISQTISDAATSTPSDVELELKKFLHENCWGMDSVAGDGEVEADDECDEEMLDSLGWVQLLTFVNKRFGVKVSDTEVANDCDWSLHELANLIQAKKVA